MTKLGVNFYQIELFFYFKSAFDILHLSSSILHKYNRGVAQLASALRSGRRGRKFESSHPDIFYTKPLETKGFLFVHAAIESQIQKIQIYNYNSFL